MLIKTNTIGQDDIDMAAKQFDLLDKDQSGSLGIQEDRAAVGCGAENLRGDAAALRQVRKT